MTYAELHVATHFSFLRGTSSCDELFAAAALLGLPAIAITDRNSVAGMVRALKASEATGTRLVCGCRLDLLDGTSLLVWPEDRAGWSRLTRLLTLGKSRAVPKKGEKGQCFIAWEDVAAHSQGLVAALIPDEADEATARAMALVAEIFPARAYATLSYRRRPGDALRLHALDALARRHGVVPLATGDVLYHSPDRRILHDVVTAIRHGCTIDDLGFRRERNLDRHLKGPIEMARRFARWPEALRASEAVAERCTFSLRELDYQYPVEQVMTKRTPQQALERLTFDALATMFPGGVPDAYAGLARHELELIGRLGYAPYFLTVNSIVGFARSQGILCQGRGSAANSVVCFALGITSIDPVKHELLFERFVSGERDEPPDIDVDFEHERREEVIQWIYDTYGHNHAALTAVVSRFRTRGAVREVGKALGLSEDVTAMIAGQIWHWSPDGVDHKHVAPLGLHLDDPRLALTLQLARELIGTPRHLSQHPGGFVLTDLRLDDLVPIEPAAMDERRVIEWDKDDIAILGFMKVDVLGLGMLGCMRRAFDLLEDHKGQRIGLVDLQDDDPATYEMIQRADTLGTFQIESRAQMNMLPRMKPKEFYDLVIEVAIVRPGPIQGDMVHPYLRRREGKEEPEYPKPELEAVLKKTLGVPLFQEQAMKVAIVGAGFTPAEADELRRSMATFKITDGVSHFRDRLIEGMVANGYQRDFAERTFKQIEGFGSYGFPESHAASFAKIAYASCWMKCHHPDVFTCALLNAQPMGFYAPAQIVRDARDHDVEVLPPCINLSRWDSYLIPSAPRRRGRAPCAAWEAEGLSKQRRLALSTSGPHPDPIPRRGEGELMPIRLGLRLIGGLSNDDGAAIVMARGDAPFVSIEDAWRRSGVPGAALERLAEADAFACIGIDRRQALWQVRGLAAAPLCLFAAADAREAEGEPEVRLRMMTAGREVVEDYRTIQLSLRAHPLHFLRADLAARGITACGDLAKLKDGARIEVSGIILVRQRPGSTDVVFITVEDETGVANIVVWASLFEKARRTIMSSSMIGVKGRLQREGIVIHVVAETIEDQTGLLRSVGDRDFRPTSSRGDAARHPGNDPRYPHADPRPQIRVKTRDFR